MIYEVAYKTVLNLDSVPSRDLVEAKTPENAYDILTKQLKKPIYHFVILKAHSRVIK